MSELPSFQALDHLSFDSDVFGFPFFRANVSEIDELRQEIEQLCAFSVDSIACDAKSNFLDIATIDSLKDLGFRKICDQVTCEVSPRNLKVRTDHEVIEATSMSDADIVAHSSNFTLDRLSLDSRITPKTVKRFYGQWIHNAFSFLGKKVYVLNSGMCIVRQEDDTLKIDLVSVLEKRQGLGARLIDHALAQAKADGVRLACVTTEAHNDAAIRLYEQNGFREVSRMTCLHLFHLVAHQLPT